jgi:RNA polymerase-binding transcription factor DksA
MNVSRDRRAKPGAKKVARELVGNSRPGWQIKPKWRKHYRRLVELYEHLLKEKQDQFHDALEERPTFSMHMADAATDSYDRDLTLSMLSHEQDAVYEIEEALNRIRNGTYGICELTGRRIPAARLEAVPWTRFTASAERTLAHQRTQLGSLQRVHPNEPTRETTDEET